MWVLVLQRMLLEFVFDLVYFPVWWYTAGVRHLGIFCLLLLRNGNLYLAPGLWLRNIFVPMYGQTDLQGRFTSVFMRLINVFGRSIGLLFWFILVLLIFCAWFVLPIFIVYMLIKALFA